MAATLQTWLCGQTTQAAPFTPQAVLLVPGATQVPLLQQPAQLPAPQLHCPLTQDEPAGQTLPQVPQLLWALFRLTQLPLQLVVPCGQQMPFEQV